VINTQGAHHEGALQSNSEAQIHTETLRVTVLQVKVAPPLMPVDCKCVSVVFLTARRLICFFMVVIFGEKKYTSSNLLKKLRGDAIVSLWQKIRNLNVSEPIT
jgi:hypothetical protein